MSNRINLLNPSASPQAQNPPEGPSKWLVILCVLLMIATVGAYGIILGLDVKARNSQLNASGSNSAPAAGQAGEREALAAERERTAANIKKLEAEKPRMSLYLDELLQTMTASVVLTSLEIKDKPFEVTIKGVSASHFYVSQFGRNLQDSEHFRDAVLSASEKRVKENLFEYMITITPERKGGVSSAAFINR